jgi:hypothetical protein
VAHSYIRRSTLASGQNTAKTTVRAASPSLIPGGRWRYGALPPI